MSVIRSVLWIGSGDTLSDRGVVDAPTLDVTWVRDVDEAFALSPSGFDVVVLAGEDPAPLLGALRQLRRATKFPPVLACLPELCLKRSWKRLLARW